MSDREQILIDALRKIANAYDDCTGGFRFVLLAQEALAQYEAREVQNDPS